MQEQSMERISVQPWFDFEKIMSLSGETRIGTSLMEDMAKHWQAWTPKIKAINFLIQDQQYLAVWLPEDVENYIDQVWAHSASEAFMYNLVAIEMIMSSVAEIIPEVAKGGCAPAPKINKEMISFLQREGLDFNDNSLLRRYATLTYFPYKGGCESCTLLNECPKGQAGDSLESVELPGHTFTASDLEQ